ncbi:MAG: hypothetical protein ACRC8S_14480 [Fimbriiglobus sp.]
MSTDYRWRSWLVTIAVCVGGAGFGFLASMVADVVVPSVQTDVSENSQQGESATLTVLLANHYVFTRSGPDSTALREEALWWSWLPALAGMTIGAAASLFIRRCYRGEPE